MNHKSYKKIIILLAICFLTTTFAQKVNKKFTENFKVNKDVEIAINATNTAINVTTWNKNEVQVDAFIEVEGVSKKEAEKYFKNWKFEALGNRKKVQITSKGSFRTDFKIDTIYFDNMNYDFNFNFSDIDMPNSDTIVLPEMNFDFDFNFDEIKILEDFDDIDKMVGRNGDYQFIWKDKDYNIEINSKEEWETFKKTKEYKNLKKKMKISKEKMRVNFFKSKEKMKKAFAKSRKEIAKIDRAKLKKALAKAKENLKKIKFNFSTNSNGFMFDGKKIKIKKRLEIKVPKGATFNLNTRHCKVKLPNTIAYGKVKYGTFDVDNLLGGKLSINYAPVRINDLNACTLFLNNVTDAKITSITNTALSNNSSDVKIVRVNENVNITDEFGELIIDSFKPNFGNFVLNVSQSNVTINLGKIKTTFNYNIKNSKLDNKSSLDFMNNVIKKYKVITKSTITNNKTKNNFKLNADYSSIVVK